MNVVATLLDPERLPNSAFGRFFAKRRLSRMMDVVGDDGISVLVEEVGDTARGPWMVYALGSPLKKIAVPVRMKGIGNVGEPDSGVVTYEMIASVDDLKKIEHEALWSAQTCAYSMWEADSLRKSESLPFELYLIRPVQLPQGVQERDAQVEQCPKGPEGVNGAAGGKSVLDQWEMHIRPRAEAF